VTQSLSLLQCDRQLPVPHTYGLQPCVLTWLHVPLPLQNDGGRYVVPEHEDAMPHVTDVGCCVQAPPPLQAPVLPHSPLGAQRPCGSLVPEPTLAQVPAALMLHAWQVEQPFVLQQTPSMQLLLMHWLPAPQVEPSARFATQLPGAETFPVQ
jgi:hypothetical protein